MGHSKLSVTIPDDIYDQIHEFASKENMKLSHLVTEALVARLKLKKEQAYIEQVNEVFKNKEAAEEQRRMGETIAVHTDIEELPW